MLIIWFGISNTCVGMWLNGLGKNRKTGQEHDEECVEKGFRLDRAKIDRNGKGGRKALGMGNCSINTWDGSGLKLASSKKISSCFENNFPLSLSFGISNTLISKLHDVLY